MNVYLLKDGQPVGPFTREELQEKIYAGELARTDSARLEDQTDWKTLAEVLATPPPVISPDAPPAPTGGPNLEFLRDPKEKTALLWLYIASVPVWLLLILLTITTYGMPLIVVLLYFLLYLLGLAWFAAMLKTNAVRVSPTQLPEIHRLVQAGSQRLGMEEPQVFVMQYNLWNAFAVKLFRQRTIVLLSGAVDSILLKGDHRQLAWLIGHELGHHWAGHLDNKKKLAALGGWCIWLKLWHSRRAELTADRVGLYCAGSLAASQLALMNATVGAQLASRVNLAEAEAQWRQHSSEFFVQYRTIYATHPHLLARLYHLSLVAQELGISR